MQFKSAPFVTTMTSILQIQSLVWEREELYFPSLTYIFDSMEDHWLKIQAQTLIASLLTESIWELRISSGKALTRIVTAMKFSFTANVSYDPLLFLILWVSIFCFTLSFIDCAEWLSVCVPHLKTFIASPPPPIFREDWLQIPTSN